jgi:3D (Asp-Asp-Asp) domain-containing protein
MRNLPSLLLCLSAAMLASCSSTSPISSIAAKKGTHISSVRTTAYTHSEADHIVYGKSNAVDGSLKYGNVRSAAADWSVYPVGTVFQIEGTSNIYQVDDYGSALVGTNTIDLYKPTRQDMNEWGVRKVNIRVLRWGSFTKSLSILKPRSHWSHVGRMVHRIEGKM